MAETDDLKRAASVERANIQARIREKQGGVPTYFDAFLCNFLNRLLSSESLHDWTTNAEQASADSSKARVAAELQWFVNYLQTRKEGRFVSYETRRKQDATGGQSGIRSPERMMSQGMAECLTWKGRPLFKTVFDFAILPMLVWELKPGTVFEIGSGTGASACWLADTIQTAGLSSGVYSADVKLVTERYAGVQFLTGDCTSPATLFEPDLLHLAARPFLVIEDAHVNVRNVLLYLDAFLREGDYLFVEDSVNKADAIEAFLRERSGRYAVDSRYTDFFGRNATSAINSIFVRV